MIGKFYLGLVYDYQQIWMQNLAASEQRVVAIYPCTQEKEFLTKNQQG